MEEIRRRYISLNATLRKFINLSLFIMWRFLYSTLSNSVFVLFSVENFPNEKSWSR